MQRGAAAMGALALLAASCAVVGFDLSGYKAGEGGGGNGGESSSSHAVGSGGSAGATGPGPGPGPSSGSSNSSSGSGSSGCSPDEQCFEPAPAGWSGPQAYYSGPPGVACAPPYAMPAHAGGTQADQTPVTCSACKCGTDACQP